MMSWLASLPERTRVRALSKYTDEQLGALRYDWRAWARPKQVPPDSDWFIWLLMSGRGAGKTRSGAEWVRARANSKVSRGVLIAPTPADARDVMIDGESGLLAIGPEPERPTYEPTKRLLTWPNGSSALVRSGHDPEGLRGPQHEWGWCDELAAWQYPRETWDMFMMGLRLGEKPQAVITTTPKPISLLKELLARQTAGDVVVTTESTYENLENLSPAFRKTVVERYEGTSLGEQELHAKLLTEAEGALWRREWIQRKDPPDLARVVVAIDPAGTSKATSNETGIVVAGRLRDEGFILADRSGRYSPRKWAETAIRLYEEFKADRIVAEKNQGGEMVEYTLRTVDPHISYKAVDATRGKRTRAEPIASLYEKGTIYHAGHFNELEDQLCTWEPDSGQESPDRLDAAVWGLTELFPKTDVPRFDVPVSVKGRSYFKSV